MEADECVLVHLLMFIISSEVLLYDSFLKSILKPSKILELILGQKCSVIVKILT